MLSITDLHIDDDMSDAQVTALYDKAVELVGGEDVYVPGANNLVPVEEEPLQVWNGLVGPGECGRDVWNWSASGPREDEDVTQEELREIQIDMEGPVLVMLVDDEADELVRNQNVAPEYVPPPMYGSWEVL